MKNAYIGFGLLLYMSLAATAWAVDGKPRELSTDGAAYALLFDGSTFRYCDHKGQHVFNLTLTSDKIAEKDVCPKPQEPNSSCSDQSPSLTVSSVHGAANDTVESDKWSAEVKGRVHDCAQFNDHVGIVTGSGVQIIDSKGKVTTVSPDSADRVALNKEWIVWATKNQIYLQKIQ